MKGNGSYGHIKVLPFFLTLLLLSCGKSEPQPGQVLDEARRAGRTAQSFPAAPENYFQAMDGGIALTTDEVKGRNTWIVWSGGNDRFWDTITQSAFGAFDPTPAEHNKSMCNDFEIGSLNPQAAEIGEAKHASWRGATFTSPGKPTHYLLCVSQKRKKRSLARC